MAAEYIAVEDFEVEFVDPLHSGDIELIGSPSTEVEIDGVGVHNITLIVKITNGSNGTDVTNGTGAGPFIALAAAQAPLGFPLLRENDLAPVVVTGTNAGAPPPTKAYVSVVRIKDGKQTIVKGDV